MSVILIPVATFAAGYLLRGWLAVLWERKRAKHRAYLRAYLPPKIVAQLGKDAP